MNKINIGIVGNGAREHALGLTILKSPRVKEVCFFPGNGGTAWLGFNKAILPTDIKGLIDAFRDYEIDLVVVGPEVPLALGLVDACHAADIPAFGPTKAAARIEASKSFAKELMRKYRIPCAHGRSFATFSGAREYALNQKLPVVIKADGLAAGKGVVVAKSYAEAEETLHDFMVRRILGDAGNLAIIEECLFGKEVSLLAFVDGTTVVPMAPACDYKRRDKGDEGPNTGGMGSYSFPGILTPKMTAKILREILVPVVKALGQEGITYSGVIYAGLMLTDQGPKVLEFNCRFGDPEIQAILPRLKTDLVEIMLAVVHGDLRRTNIQWSSDACVGVVLASGGYPGKYQTGFPIAGLNEVAAGIGVCHAGTKVRYDGVIVTDGGRVLTVVAKGATIAEARSIVYGELPKINFPGCFYRMDIAEGIS